MRKVKKGFLSTSPSFSMYRTEAPLPSTIEALTPGAGRWTLRKEEGEARKSLKAARTGAEVAKSPAKMWILWFQRQSDSRQNM